jgi:hypothetical protein
MFRGIPLADQTQTGPELRIQNAVSPPLQAHASSKGFSTLYCLSEGHEKCTVEGHRRGPNLEYKAH